jgi:hypothetical protein
LQVGKVKPFLIPIAKGKVMASASVILRAWEKPTQQGFEKPSFHPSS